MKKIGLLLLLVLIVFAGCGSNDDDDYNFEYEETLNLTWPADDITRIVASTKNGAISVTANNDTIITADILKTCKSDSQEDAEAHIDDITIHDEIDSNQLIIEADMPDCCDRTYQADFDITAPKTIFLDLTTINGAFFLGNMRSGARLRTTNGAMALSNHQGNINAATVNGTIVCDVSLLASGKSIILSSTNGEIELSLPSDVSAAFNASTVNGIVSINGFDAISYSTNTDNHKSGVFGSGDATITISLVNGNILIHAR